MLETQEIEISTSNDAIKAGASSTARHQVALLRQAVKHGGNAAATLPPCCFRILAASSGGERMN